MAGHLEKTGNVHWETADAKDDRTLLEDPSDEISNVFIYQAWLIEYLKAEEVQRVNCTAGPQSIGQILSGSPNYEIVLLAP